MSQIKFCITCKVPIYKTSIQCKICCKQNPAYTGKNHFMWKGNKAGYLSIHRWVIRKLGQPDTCNFCNESKLFGRKIHWANKSGKYKRDLDDWLRLCIPCHKNYDKQFDWSKIKKKFSLI